MMSFTTNLIIGMFCVALVFGGLSMTMLSMGNTYNVEVGEEYEEIFDNYGGIQDFTTDTQDIIEGGEINPEGQDQAIYKNVIVAAKQMQQSGKLFLKMLYNIPKIFDVAPSTLLIIGSLVMFLVGTSLLYFMTGRKP